MNPLYSLKTMLWLRHTNQVSSKSKDWRSTNKFSMTNRFPSPFSDFLINFMTFPRPVSTSLSFSGCYCHKCIIILTTIHCNTSTLATLISENVKWTSQPETVNNTNTKVNSLSTCSHFSGNINMNTRNMRQKCKKTASDCLDMSTPNI